MEIKSILESTRDKLENGQMTMREARELLCSAGWFNYLPSEKQVTHLLQM